MARRKEDQTNTRKLTRLGQTSLAVTLPIGLVRKLGWQERQKVVVKQSGRHLIIKDWRK